MVGQAAQSTARLDVLAEFCVQELAVRGLEGAKCDPETPGHARSKNWDVVWSYRDKPRLAVSLKSLLANVSGSVPNRTDDLMGEVVNLQMYSPEVVIGYLMIFNRAEDSFSKKHHATWGEVLRSRLGSLSGRRAPHWTMGTIEAFAVVEIDFSTAAELISGADAVSEMFDCLAREVRQRNPDLRKA